MAQCLTPFTMLNEKTNKYMDIPCGKCLDCTNRRASGWSFRLMYEERRAISAHFVTLTYNTTHVPITQKGFMTLKTSDLQDFMKRLRKYENKHNNNPIPLKYYACGEYGSYRDRPHYHIILFNASPQGIERSWTIKGRRIGDIHIGTVSEASVGYTLKYMCKDPTNPIPRHYNDDRKPQFAIMSKGLGKNYVGKWEKQYQSTITVIRNGSEYQRKIYKDILVEKSQSNKWHKKDIVNRMLIPLSDGKKISMPRYYKQKIYTSGERDFVHRNMANLIQPRFETEQERLQQIQANEIKQKRNKTRIQSKL